MKNFIITSKVQSIKTMQYMVKANSLEEAICHVSRGYHEGLGEEMSEEIDYSTETDIDGWEDKDEFVTIPAGTKGVWVKQNNPSYNARFGAMVEVTDDYYGGDMINIKWLDFEAQGQMDGGYFISDFTFNV
jgi:uncharacterized protein YjdB